METVVGYPPNYEAIAKRFDIKGRPGIIFAYGDKLYNPGNYRISDDLMVHEETHFSQQKLIGVELWWNKYLSDDEFRLQQEVEAYQKQYQYIRENFSRPHRRYRIKQIAKDLSGPIYGNLVSFNEAEELITS